MIKIVWPKFYPLYRKMFLWLGAAVFVAVGMGFGVIQPSFARLEQTTEDIKKTLADNAASSELIKNLIQVKRDREQLEEKLNTLQSAFIQDHNPLPYLTQLESLATAHQVELDFDVQPITDSEPTTKVTAIVTTITVSGSWDNAIGFINEVMTLPIFYRTTQLEVVAPAGTTDSVSISLDGLTYWQ